MPQGFNKPFVSPHLDICICHEGFVEVDYDGDRRNFQAHDIAIIYPNHSLTVLRASDDYRVTHIRIFASFYDQIAKLKMNRNRVVFERTPHFRLTDSQYEDVVAYIDTVKRLLHYDLNEKENTLTHMLCIFFYLVDTLYDANEQQPPSSNRKLSYRFYNALAQHYARHHDVQFYADLFCLTAKHFSSVIKIETDHTVSYWIQNFIVARAKVMLAYEPDMSVQEVSHRLGFPDQATFCRYFKRTAGMAPSVYQQKNLIDSVPPPPPEA